MNFVKKANTFLCVSLILMSVAIFVIFKYKFNKGIDFTGGIVIEYSGSAYIKDIQKISPNIVINSVGNITHVKFASNDSEKLASYLRQINNILLKNNAHIIKSDFIGSQFSDEIIFNSILSIIFSICMIFVYVAFKFGIKMSLGAVFALIHDCIILVGICSFFKIEFNLIIISALLTIIGYSINDTVVVFDKIRSIIYEKYGKKQSYIEKDIVNSAINSVLRRSIMTSFVTSIAITPLMFVKDTNIHNFSMIVLIGIFIGTMSSIFISAIISRYGKLSIPMPKDKIKNDDPMRFV